MLSTYNKRHSQKLPVVQSSFSVSILHGVRSKRKK